jgi:hypothetical protein
MQAKAFTKDYMFSNVLKTMSYGGTIKTGLCIRLLIEQTTSMPGYRHCKIRVSSEFCKGHVPAPQKRL